MPSYPVEPSINSNPKYNPNELKLVPNALPLIVEFANLALPISPSAIVIVGVVSPL